MSSSNLGENCELFSKWKLEEKVFPVPHTRLLACTKLLDTPSGEQSPFRLNMNLGVYPFVYTHRLRCARIGTQQSFLNNDVSMSAHVFYRKILIRPRSTTMVDFQCFIKQFHSKCARVFTWSDLIKMLLNFNLSSTFDSIDGYFTMCQCFSGKFWLQAFQWIFYSLKFFDFTCRAFRCCCVICSIIIIVIAVVNNLQACYHIASVQWH